MTSLYLDPVLQEHIFETFSIIAALLKLPHPAPSSLAPLCLPPPSTDDLLGLRFFFAFACWFVLQFLAPTVRNIWQLGSSATCDKPVQAGIPEKKIEH